MEAVESLVLVIIRCPQLSAKQTYAEDIPNNNSHFIMHPFFSLCQDFVGKDR
uniref:Uncharacterized protein n=1 Tax=Anguilla anguilla TaxID=7936 RepID=A0A0E9U9G3_ANGAN